MTLGMIRSTISSLMLFVAPGLLLSCPDQKTKPPPDKVEQVRLDQEFKIRVGRQVAVAGEKLKARFVSVAGDSRCPRDVTCVWAGNAEVLIQVGLDGKTADLKLHTNGGSDFPRETRHQEYRVTLVGLSPEPLSKKAIKPTEYVATLLIRKQS